MNIDKEVFEFWKEISPESAFGAGLKECAGVVWVPSHQNKKNALQKIRELKSRADPVAKKWLEAIEFGLMVEEPQDAPGQVMSVFYTHLVIEGVKEKHVCELAEQALSVLAVQEELCERVWPLELQIFSAQACDGAVVLLNKMKKGTKKETKDAVTALQKRLKLWKKKTCTVELKKNDFAEIFPMLEKKSTGLGRENSYRATLHQLYDYCETPEEIEQKAQAWIEEELPLFQKAMRAVHKRYGTKENVEEINKALEKNQHIPLKELVSTTIKLRKSLQKIAEKEWVKITPKYDIRVIETPKYLVPFLPTAAMQPFNSLKNPFCISFVTTNKKASPSTFLPGVVQTLVHEEYGHCVNFMNSYQGFCGKLRLPEILDSTLSTPITEGISFFREWESIQTFERIAKGARSKDEQAFVKLIETVCPFDAFVDGIRFEVMQWRMVRFLRAVSDVRLNLELQTFPEFINWANEKTGLSKKLVFDQTFHFQEHPGYAPCYSVFGQRLRELQKLAKEKGISQLDFNTFVASRGFPARSLFEQELMRFINK